MNAETRLELMYPRRDHRQHKHFGKPILRFANIDYKTMGRISSKATITLYKTALQLLDVESGDKVLLAKDPLSGEYCLASIPRGNPSRGNTLSGPKLSSKHFDSRLLYNKLPTGYYRLDDAFLHKLTGLWFHPLTFIGTELDTK